MEPGDVSNYRPISNLSSLSKILERLVLSRLQPFLLSSQNFSPYQSAYRKLHSTETCILKTLSDIYKSIDEGLPTLLVSLDLSAAFDTISHSILLERLKLSFGINHNALNWIRSYLHGRTQAVALSGFKSSPKSLNSGVPQGSVLGPLLFSVYISPVSNLVEIAGLKHQIYADDTQIYSVINKLQPSQSLKSLESCLALLSSWYTHNYLFINPAKTECSLFGSPHQLTKFSSANPINVSLSNVSISPSGSLKTLGITIDSALSFKPQVGSLIKSLNFHIRALRHVRHLLTKKDAGLLAIALVHAKLDYCNSILSNTTATNINSLQKLQNRLARLVLRPGLPCHSVSSASLLHDLHWLPIRKRISFKIASLTHTALHQKEPSYLNELLLPYIPSRMLRSSDQGFLVIPRSRLVQTSRSFHIASPSIWNSLPPHLRLETNPTKFRTGLKTFLFQSAD